MKIALLSHTGSVTGGAEQCLLEYVDLLTSKGHKCMVIVPKKGDMTRVLSERGIEWKVVGFGWATRPHRRVRPFRIMASTGNSLVRIFQEIEKYRPNLIITNTAVIPWGLYAGRMFKIPTVLLVHEVLSDKDPSLNMMPSYHEYAEVLNKNTDYVVYNSQFVKSEFADVLRLPQTSKNILYPLPPLDKDKIEHFFRRNVIGSKLRIAIFGAVSPRKNQMEALQAAKILKERGIHNFTIDLYGDKEANVPYTKMLRKFIADNSLKTNVKIKGFTTSVYEKMNEYNVVLSTATYEPFGRTIIEGQLFSRIAITNDTGGGPELVTDSVNGLVYKLGDSSQLADKITWIINNKQAALELGAAAKTGQFEKFITSSRYDALLDAVAYFDGRGSADEEDIYDPLMCLFQYNHQLNNRYKHVYRIFHNRITYAVKGVLDRLVIAAKKVIKQLLP